MKKNIKYTALMSLSLLNTVLAYHTTLDAEANTPALTSSTYQMTPETLTRKIDSIDKLNDVVASLDGQSVIGFDFDDTLARRHVFTSGDLVDDILFHTENTRDRRAQFKAFLERYEILPNFQLTGVKAIDNTLEDAYLKEGASIVRNKLLVAAAERFLAQPKNVHVPHNDKMIAQTHQLMPVEGELTKKTLESLGAKNIAMGVCSVMQPAKERITFADSLGLSTYIQGHDKLKSLTDIVLQKDLSAVKNLILVDNYSGSGDELMNPEKYGYASREETLNRIKERLAPGVRLVSVVYEPKKDVSKTGIGLSQAYFTALNHPAVKVPMRGSSLGPNSHLANAFSGKSKKDAMRILETIGVNYGSAAYPGQSSE